MWQKGHIKYDGLQADPNCFTYGQISYFKSNCPRKNPKLPGDSQYPF